MTAVLEKDALASQPTLSHFFHSMDEDTLSQLNQIIRQAYGYHSLLCYDGLTGDLLKAELRDGTMYCSKEADFFMKSLLEEFLHDFPDMPLYFCGDSGFASPDLYEALEDKNCKYVLRLKGEWKTP